MIDDHHIFDPTRKTLLAIGIVKHRLLHRINRWNEHCDAYIKDDLEVPRRASEPFRSELEGLATVPYNLVITAVNAYFRAMYFAHGTSRAYNYTVLRNVFVDGSEKAATRDEIVALHPATVDGTTDRERFHFPIYSKDILTALTSAIKHVCELSRIFETDDPVVYLIVVYTSWAYQKFLDGKSRNGDNDRRIIESVLQDVRSGRSPFDLEAFLDRCEHLER